MKFLLRIAGVNIVATVEDTRQLSVRRGSSLLLKKAIKDIESYYECNTDHPFLQNISSGASTGLFLFKLESKRQAIELRDAVAKDLADHENYQFLTFVVDITLIENDNFNLAHEQVIALNQYRQFKQPTMAFPKVNDQPNTQPCAWDNQRPANGNLNQHVKREDRGPAHLSLSCERRHDFGRTQKQVFVKEETTTSEGQDDGLTYTYTNDLHQIASEQVPSHLSNLGDKLAVVYFDGNGFGGIQKECGDENELHIFDLKIQNKRKAWLRDLIETLQTHNEFKVSLEQSGRTVEALRLEILLWGGDEIMLAVPAWFGMQVLQHFYTFHNQWEYNGKQLTHASGLVFCHVKTPIQRIQSLSKEIADHIKDTWLGISEGKIDKYIRGADLFDYVVLESIDYPTQSWATFLTKRYTHDVANHWRPLRPLYNTYQNHRKIFTDQIKNSLPRRQLYRLAQAIVENSQEFGSAKIRFDAIVENADNIEKDIKALFPGIENNLHWIHLVELWDYFAAPEKPNLPRSN